jgi:predicted nucleotidyltransferase
MGMSEQWYKFKPLPANIKERIWQKLPDFLAQNGVELAYLFGSLAQDGPANDVDIALLMPAEQPAFPMRQLIAEWLDVERIDVVDLRLAHPVLRFEIISNGKLLYGVSEENRRQFEMSVLREYKDTAYLRRSQEQMLRARSASWLSNEKA